MLNIIIIIKSCTVNLLVGKWKIRLVVSDDGITFAVLSLISVAIGTWHWQSLGSDCR